MEMADIPNNVFPEGVQVRNAQFINMKCFWLLVCLLLQLLRKGGVEGHGIEDNEVRLL